MRDEITCGICMDLMPLVRDGIATDDSRRAVEAHIKNCAACHALYSGGTPPAVNTEKAFHQFKRKMRFFSVMLMMFGIFFGLSLTAGADMFYNSLIMPVIGALGYALFHWQALYRVPLLLLVTHSLVNAVRMTGEDGRLDLYSLLLWTAMYSFFALVGVLISGLLYYVLKGGIEVKKRILKTAAFLLALLLMTGLGAFANALVGNPVSRMLAERTVKKYLSENYGDTDFVMEQLSYSFKDGSYWAHIQSPSSADSSFTLYLDMGGRLSGDSYAQMVLSGENTARRLNQAYRELTDTVFESSVFPFDANIAFGDLQFEAPEELELDRPYDIQALGARAGYLTVYIDDQTVSMERAAEIMLEIKRLMDEGGAPFYAMNFVLQYPLPEEGVRPQKRVEAREFLYTDIYASGMEERVKAADDAACND